MHNILGIETSCDDTAFAVVENGQQVLGMHRIGQPFHNQYGGVVPEAAARLHAENWQQAYEETLTQSGKTLTDMDAIAVTFAPGLQTSLLTGVTVANTLAADRCIPLIPVHHLYGHISSLFLERKQEEILFPLMVFIVSGGHTHLYRLEDMAHARIISATRDDAAGEAYDKVAKMLGLGYPGGPIVEQYAAKGDSARFALPRPLPAKTDLDFSFSGLKATVYRLVQQQDDIDDSFRTDMCAAFEAAVEDTFTRKIGQALTQNPDIKQLGFVGGVSANTRLSRALERVATERNIDFVKPVKTAFSTDNGAMIAAAAYQLLRAGLKPEKDFAPALPVLDLQTWLEGLCEERDYLPKPGLWVQ